VRGASLVVSTVGAVVFASWLLDVDALKSLVAGTSTMKANSSLLFALGGWRSGLQRPGASGERFGCSQPS
jgi:hypothetical protein